VRNLRGSALIVVLVAWLTVAASASPSVTTATVLRAALPSSRLEFGLSNLDINWMTSSGVPWRYRYQYLAGGVNTSGNWLTWQDPAKPPGQFALDYMTNSAASSSIPVFTYYELLQSTPSSGSTELDRDYNNLNNASTMSAYYANFKILMQKAGQYGGQLVVHVEPDFWGYMQQRAAGGDATTVSAMVKSSGFPEASAFADDVAGFASELKYLRDTYAPNALLAMHASMWSSGIDIASNPDPSVNATSEADKTAAFLSSAGATGWDALFNDVDDHDAAWWELASCGSPPCVNRYFTHWWDTTNVSFPNFSRYLAWVGELYKQIGRPQVVWQVPAGNQFYLTMNNTCGHYQDNVAQYFIGHTSDLFNAGVVAVLFGAGNNCQTSYDDTMKDGVTNNNGAPTTDQLGGCNACNVHTSNWTDDDGGYLRIFVGLYYAGQSACGSHAVFATPSSPQVQGTRIQLTASATGCSNSQFEFWLQSPTGAWTLMQPYGANATWNWDTTGFASGTYTIHAWATQTGGDTRTWQTYGELKFGLQPSPPCANATVSPASVSQPAGSTIAFTATSSGCVNPEYQFFVQYPDGSWNLKQAWGGATFSWNTSGLAPGSYLVHAWVNRTGTTYDSIGSATVTLTGCTSASLSPSAVMQPAGSLVALTAGSGGCPNPMYQFFVQYPNGSWNLKQAWSSSVGFNWDTTGVAPGVYTVHAWANQSGAAPTLEVYGSSTVTLTGCTSPSLSPSNPSQAAGTTVAFTASSSGCLNPRYEFFVQYPSGTWYLKQGFSTTVTFNWDTTGLAPGAYTVHVWVNNQGSGHDAIGSATVTLTGCTSASIMPPSGSAAVGSSTTFTASSSGCPNPAYEFWLVDPWGTWHLEQAFSTTITWTWNSAGWPKGAYTIHVWANNQDADTSTYETIGAATLTLS